MNTTENTLANAFYEQASKAMGVPAISAHAQLANMRDALDRQRRDAEATLADIQDRKTLMISEHIREREAKIAEFRAEMAGTLARERGEVQRLSDALTAANERLAKAEQDARDGAKTIIESAKFDHDMAIMALDEERQSAEMVKAAAEAGLAGAAKTVGGAA